MVGGDGKVVENVETEKIMRLIRVARGLTRLAPRTLQGKELKMERVGCRFLSTLWRDQGLLKRLGLLIEPAESKPVKAEAFTGPVPLSEPIGVTGNMVLDPDVDLNRQEREVEEDADRLPSILTPAGGLARILRKIEKIPQDVADIDRTIQDIDRKMGRRR